MRIALPFACRAIPIAASSPTFAPSTRIAEQRAFGGIATSVARYGKAGQRDGVAYLGSGIDCFQLVETAASWRIASLAWADDVE